MNNFSPRVSIIMAAFNAALFIDHAIKSVLNQSYEDWELLIVDDGSNDDTEQIVQNYARKNKRIKYFKQPNRGVSSARNVALKKMSGDYFCFLDADDRLPVDSLKSRLACFTEEDIAFSDGAVEIYDVSFKHLLRTWIPSVDGSVLKNLVRLDGKVFFGPSWMIRRVKEIDYQFISSMTHGEDLLFFISIANAGKYAFTRDVVLHYRKSKSSAMSNSIGLAKGYSSIAEALTNMQLKLSKMDLLMFQYKTRRIMFLTFLRQRKIKQAFQFLIRGYITE